MTHKLNGLICRSLRSHTEKSITFFLQKQQSKCCLNYFLGVIYKIPGSMDLNWRENQNRQSYYHSSLDSRFGQHGYLRLVRNQQVCSTILNGQTNEYVEIEELVCNNDDFMHT